MNPESGIYGGYIVDAHGRHVHTVGKRWDGRKFVCSECPESRLLRETQANHQMCVCGHTRWVHSYRFEGYNIAWQECRWCDPNNLVRGTGYVVTEAFLERAEKARHPFTPAEFASENGRIRPPRPNETRERYA